MKNQTCCVIGYPISHSLSPLIHNALYELYSIDCTYTIREIQPGQLDRFVKDIKDLNLRGFNVTMPYKKEIIPYLSRDPGLLSINTVCIQDGLLSGISTDEAGFAKSLQEENFSYENKKIAFIGAGAVTGILAADAIKKGAKQIDLLNRTLANAQQLAASVGGNAHIFDTTNSYRCIEECDLLVNTTPLGMRGCPKFKSYDFLGNLRQQTLVCDLIYQPFTTEFLMEASRRGNPTLGGISMLVWQAFYAFHFMFGIMPSEKDKEYILKIIEDRQEPTPSF